MRHWSAPSKEKLPGSAFLAGPFCFPVLAKRFPFSYNLKNDNNITGLAQRRGMGPPWAPKK